ncbi:MAG: hypothetical protein ACE5JD_12590 [Candidatus Methylomirabilia bacterium]
MLDALIKRRLRAAMRAAGLDELPILPQGRPAKTPTTPRLLEALGDITWHEFERGGTW